MKYSVVLGPKLLQSEIIEKIDQLECTLSAFSNLDFLKFFKNHSAITFIININSAEELEEAKKIQDENKDKTIILCLPLKDVELYNNLGDRLFFFNGYCNNFELLQYCLNAGACMVRIAGHLCYCAKQVREMVKCFGAQIRVLANVAQSDWYFTSAEKKFFIRPEDVSKVEPYFDICEIWLKDGVPAALDVYINQKEWDDKIDHLIYDLDLNIENKCILPAWIEYKLNCEQRCMRDGGACGICEKMQNLSDALKQAELIVQQQGI